MQEYQEQINAISEAFKNDFERFNVFREQPLTAVEGLSLVEVEALLHELEELRVKFEGRKSDFSSLMKTIGKYPSSDRRAIGNANSKLKAEFGKIWGVEGILGMYAQGDDVLPSRDRSAREILENLARILREKLESLDVTIPGRRPAAGHLHLITILRQKIEDIFVSMGYAIEDDREIETDYYNFDALNIPEGHPARESQDTFYTTEGFALRSQTSTVQIRAMERRGVPIRIIAPGKVFRRDTPDMTHVPMFHQIEGLCVDKGITMAHLKGTIEEWVKRMFGEDTITRMRPSYFPFTEPSAEFDYSCFKCHGTGKSVGSGQKAEGSQDSNLLPTDNRQPPTDRCRPCKGSGWIELGGSGMVHPNVLKGCGVDPTVYAGFAFGFGLERMCALMYSLDDIRLMFDNDVRFLEQFR